MSDKFVVKDYEGILMYKDTPIADFKIKNGNLERCIVLCDDVSKYPGYMQVWGFDNFTFYCFFDSRVIKKNSMYDRDFYNALGLKHYDAESMLKLMNGKNNTDFFWVKERGVGCSSWNEVRNMSKPVIRNDIPEYLLLGR